MGLIASLDIGTETTVMALGRQEAEGVYLDGVKFQVTQGVERGVIQDWEQVEHAVNALQSELLKEREVEVLNIGLSGAILQSEICRVRIQLQRKTIEHGDLWRAEERCRRMHPEEELIDIIPMIYIVDGEENRKSPLGKMGRELEVVFQVYKIDPRYLSRLSNLFSNIKQICFYPIVRAYQEILPVHEMKNAALVDMGAMGIQVLLFKQGLLAREAYLPLGCRTIDQDIMYAYAVNASQARRLKHEHGEALRSLCKNKKVQIPDTNLNLESRDLATIVQSRSEELLEGVVALLQDWGYDGSENKIFLTGGGSRLKFTRRISSISWNG